jgi:hypothetical protein
MARSTTVSELRARLVVLASCTVLACSGGDTRTDAGTDASNVDAEVDDTSADDANVDAALAPDDPGWERLPGYGSECWTDRARQPAAVLAYHWEPCSDGISGCQMAIVDRSVAPLADVRGLAGGNDARGVAQWHLVGTADPIEDIVVATRDDVVLAAFRQISTNPHVFCGPALVGSFDALGLDNYYGPAPTPSRDHVSFGPWSDLSPLSELGFTAAFEAGSTFLETPSVSATTYAAVLTTGDVVAIESGRGSVIASTGDGPVVVGQTVLWDWSDSAQHSAIHVGGLDRPEEVLYTPPVGEHVLGVRSDTSWTVFLQGRDDPTGASVPLNELWVAPFRAAPPLAAHLVRDDLAGNGPGGTIGGGMYAYRGADASHTRDEMHVVDLASGARSTVALPFSSGIGVSWSVSRDAAWVSASEIAFPALRTEGTARLETLLRINLASLAAELPPADAGP